MTTEHQTAETRADPLEAERRLAAARFVAQHWRDMYLAEHRKGTESYWAIGTHPLALVLAALDGETNPTELGLSYDAHDAFRAALTPGAPDHE